MSSKNQIVIPREAREALDLKPGDKLVVSTVGGRIIIMERPKSYRAALAGIARGLYPKDYLKKERNSWR
ncbi:MAG: AbrB/MazE/SpoVT family DNA-binding domain-containing protein [Terriglobales bacterium]